MKNEKDSQAESNYTILSKRFEDLKSGNFNFNDEKYQELTVDQILADPKFEHLSHEEAQNIVDTIKTFCEITYRYYMETLEKENECKPLTLPDSSSD